MAIQSGQVTCTTSDKLITSLPANVKGTPELTVTLITASASVYISGAGVATTNGHKLQAGTTAPWPVVVIRGTGEAHVVGAAGSEIVTFLLAYVD